MDDFTGAVERIVAGLEKKSRILIPRERRIVAYHEMGHALVALAIPGSDPIQKVSIIPRRRHVRPGLLFMKLPKKRFSFFLVI